MLCELVSCSCCCRKKEIVLPSLAFKKHESGAHRNIPQPVASVLDPCSRKEASRDVSGLWCSTGARARQGDAKVFADFSRCIRRVLWAREIRYQRQRSASAAGGVGTASRASDRLQDNNVPTCVPNSDQESPSRGRNPKW